MCAASRDSLFKKLTQAGPAERPFVFLKRARYSGDPFGAYQNSAGEDPGVLLESSRTSQKTGRYSLIGVCPSFIFSAKAGQITLTCGGHSETRVGDPLEILRRIFGKFQLPAEPGFPPFTGGAMGYFSYEAKNLIEPRLPRTAVDDVGLPDIYLLFFESGLVVDHEKKESWIFLYQWSPGGRKPSPASVARRFESLERLFSGPPKGPRTPARRHPRTAVSMPRVQCSLDREGFMEKVEVAKEYIRRGDIFQANLSQRLSFKLGKDAFDIYRKLRRINPSPFFGFLQGEGFQVISGSPERLVKLENRVLETRPIAGTR